MNTIIDERNTASYEDAIIKSQKHFNLTTLTYVEWCTLVKKIVNYEASYTKGFKPSPEQYRALLTLAKRVLLDACPGSGKTATLIFKMFLDSGLFNYGDGDQLAITYSNEAAKEMKYRYETICRKYHTTPSANVSTIHKFAKDIETLLSPLEVLDPTGMEVEVYNEDSYNEDIDFDENEFGMMLIDDDEDFSSGSKTEFISDNKFIDEAITNLGLGFEYKENLGKISGWISTIIEKDIRNDAEFNKIPDFNELENIYLDELIQIHKYTKNKRLEYGVMNFSDMLIGLYERLVNTKTLEDIKEDYIRQELTFKVIYVDEYQDISPLQYNILKELIRLNPSVRLFCVGDADQSIYTFRGANSNFLTKFESYFREESNWRIDLYGEDNNNDIAIGTLETEILNPFVVRQKLSSKEAMDNLISEFMGELGGNIINKQEINEPTDEDLSWDKENGENKNFNPDEDVDIIYFTSNRRSSKEIIELSNFLIEKNKNRNPKVMKNVNEYDSTINIIVQYLGLDVNANIISKLGISGKSIEEIDLSDTAIIYREKRQASNLISDLIAMNIPLKTKKESLPFLFKETDDIINIIKLITNPMNTTLLENHLNKICASVNKQKAKVIAESVKSTGKPFSAFLPNTKTAGTDIADMRIIYKLLKNNRLSEAIDKIAIRYQKHFMNYFSDSSSDKIESAVYFLKALKMYDYKELIAEVEKKKKDTYSICNTSRGLNLLTMHGSKSLEFENVFILPISDTEMHKKRIVEKLAGISLKFLKDYEEEERRLLYVGITRAKKNLTIYLSNKTDLFCKELYEYMQIAKTKSSI